MIDQQKGKYILICDNCDETTGEEYDSFDDAVQAIKENGWVNKKYADGWKNICAECNK